MSYSTVLLASPQDFSSYTDFWTPSSSWILLSDHISSLSGIFFLLIQNTQGSRLTLRIAAFQSLSETCYCYPPVDFASQHFGGI